MAALLKVFETYVFSTSSLMLYFSEEIHGAVFLLEIVLC